MKTLQEVKDEVAVDSGHKEWESVGELGVSDWQVDEISKRYALEVAREALKNASFEVPRIIMTEKDYDNAKKDVLSETNIPELT